MFANIKNLHKKIRVQKAPKYTTIRVEGKRTFMGIIDSWILDGFEIMAHKTYDGKNNYIITMKTVDFTKRYGESTTPEEYFDRLTDRR